MMGLKTQKHLTHPLVQLKRLPSTKALPVAAVKNG
jgi:hypothetical protein